MNVRARYWLAMGLPLAACEKEPAHQPDTASSSSPVQVATAAASTATATATASVTATATAAATATPAVTASSPPPARGLSNVPHFSSEYPFANNRGCSTAEAHCYLLGDLQKQASAGSSCPAHEDVPQGCMGGAACADPGARTQGDLLAAVSRKETAAKHATACCYTVPDLCCAGCGRTLRDGEHVVLTPLARRSDWSSDVAPLRSDAAKARIFAAMAAAEHASIASFARTTLDLLALGAPSDLVAATHAAALDEIDHAKTCYAIASRLAGAPVGPGPLATPPHAAATFASFAVSTLLDACIGETVGVDRLRALAREETDDEIARALVRIADDEERHAELAFRTLAWAVRSGGDAARRAVHDALDRVDLATRGDVAFRDIVLPCVRGLLRYHSFDVSRGEPT